MRTRRRIPRLTLEEGVVFWQARDVCAVQGCLWMVLCVVLLPLLALPVVALLAGLEWLSRFLGG